MNRATFFPILALRSYSTAISWKDQVISSGCQPAQLCWPWRNSASLSWLRT